MYIFWTRPGSYSLLIGKPIEALTDVTDAEKSGGVQVWQNPNQELRRQSKEKVIKHQYKEETPTGVFILCRSAAWRSLEVQWM